MQAEGRFGRDTEAGAAHPSRWLHPDSQAIKVARIHFDSELKATRIELLDGMKVWTERSEFVPAAECKLSEIVGPEMEQPTVEKDLLDLFTHIALESQKLARKKIRMAGKTS